MVKAEKKTKDPVWLRLRGYHVVALKPEFDEHAIELESAIQRGIIAYPDLARGDFYDVALEDRRAYIHVYPDGHTVYLIAAHPLSREMYESEQMLIVAQHACGLNVDCAPNR